MRVLSVSNSQYGYANMGVLSVSEHFKKEAVISSTEFIISTSTAQ